MSLFARLPVTGAPHEPPHGFSQVLPAWRGETAVVVAGGPSLTQAQVERCKGRARVIVVNDSYRLAPWADLHYFADRKWFEHHRGKPGFDQFTGERCSISVSHWDDGFVPALHYLRADGPVEGLSTNPQTVRTGSNSGHQALNIAVHAGAALILLLGFDGGRGASGKKHWFGDHWDQTEPNYPRMRQALRTVDNEARARGVRIVNCSPGSAIETFDCDTIERLLPDSTTAALPA